MLHISNYIFIYLRKFVLLTLQSFFAARSIYYEKLGSGGKDSGNFSGDFELSSEVMGPEHNTNALQADHDYSAQEHYVQAAALLPVVEPKTENVMQKLSEEERRKQERDIILRKEEEEAQKAIQEYKERQVLTPSHWQKNSSDSKCLSVSSLICLGSEVVVFR